MSDNLSVVSAPSSEAAARARVVEVAHTWLGTPFHDLGRMKGVGVDCALLLAEVFCEAGVIDPVDVEAYSPQWHLHRDEERYLGYLLRYAAEIEGPPLPGDVAMFRFGRAYAHSAIVIDWPVIIHARMGQSVQIEDAERCAWLARIGEGYENPAPPRPRKFFSFWAGR